MAAAGNRPRDFLEAGAKGVALAAALLPISGVALRWIAFESGARLSVSANQLAWSAPVDQLAATGFFGLFPWVILFGGAPLLVVWLTKYPFFRSRQHHTAVEIFTNPGVVGSWVGLVIVLTVAAPFPSTALAVASGLVIGNISSWLAEKPGPLKLRHIWPVVVITLLSGSLISGSDGRLSGIQSGDYSFTQPIANTIGDGYYLQLGESGDLAYLFNCRNAGEVIGVPKSSVQSIRFIEKPGPQPNHMSLLTSWRQHQHPAIGFQPVC